MSREFNETVLLMSEAVITYGLAQKILTLALANRISEAPRK